MHIQYTYINVLFPRYKKCFMPWGNGTSSIWRKEYIFHGRLTQPPARGSLIKTLHQEWQNEMPLLQVDLFHNENWRLKKHLSSTCNLWQVKICKLFANHVGVSCLVVALSLVWFKVSRQILKGIFCCRTHSTEHTEEFFSIWPCISKVIVSYSINIHQC